MMRNTGLRGTMILLKIFKKGSHLCKMCIISWLMVVVSTLVGLEGGDQCDYLRNEGLSFTQGMGVERQRKVRF